MRAKIPFIFPLLLICVAASAQSPTPIVVQAASGTAVTSTSSTSKSGPTTTDVHSIPEAIKLLEQIKAANDEVLAKQKAALERLSELQDAADQLRIFAKRG